ncbi:TetR/AcrR family transcriptional regulator [Streptomyces albiaxialis]|uniref:TetR/AcrR family transcriptional regulator n=1 Tax=Streptomyces albiaxialis TaxID=329523 RepID=UPI003CD06312
MAEEQESVWLRPGRGTRGPAAGRTRAELADAAVRLADRGGLEAVSMRQVARELGVGQSSLYRYVASRDDLLDLMTDAAAGEIGVDAPLTGEPVEDLLALADRTRAVHVRHPWLADVPPEPLRLGPHGLDHLEYALRALAPTALTGAAKVEAVAVMNALIAQFARTERPGADADRARRRAQETYLRRAVAEGRHPYLAEALGGAAASGADAGGSGESAANGGGPDVADAHGMFRHTMRRVLTALTAPDPRG